MAQSHLSRGLPELDEILRETNELETLMTENRMSQARSEVDPISRAFSYYDMAYEPLLKDMSGMCPNLYHGFLLKHEADYV